MNSIVSINKEEDISKITKETKYINIPIDIVNNNINNYFLINGVDYSYSESINSKQGFIYTDYNMFKQGELLIDSIIKDIPQNLSDIEKVILTKTEDITKDHDEFIKDIKSLEKNLNKKEIIALYENA